MQRQGPVQFSTYPPCQAGMRTLLSSHLTPFWWFYCHSRLIDGRNSSGFSSCLSFLYTSTAIDQGLHINNHHSRVSERACSVLGLEQKRCRSLVSGKSWSSFGACFATRPAIKTGNPSANTLRSIAETPAIVGVFTTS